MINGDIAYLRLIYESIVKIEKFIAGVDEDGFLDNEMMMQACLMLLVVIGENCGKISNELRVDFKDVEWRKIKDARNFYIHSYDFVVWRRIWLTIKNELPALKKSIVDILEILEKK